MWWYVVVFIVALVVAYSMQPKPQNGKPNGFEDVQAPTAEEGIEIPVLFGTRVINGSNVCWYGDFSSRPIVK